ncbi:hypothetical protein [Candidatus Uabimicrobium amorphum]|uniref:Lipoprotein n=1 Tax=Uabimicrobium amorphum TaxID=2596890 RepID=A0A5S9ITQ3_UABAM|nr:hypothetical protein [Candidatus Uabimicrobium amorphum]BBM87381.1 hypothetical protein UABAM_05790 [Candidatus Uabimicrobium amorphum]
MNKLIALCIIILILGCTAAPQKQIENNVTETPEDPFSKMEEKLSGYDATQNQTFPEKNTSSPEKKTSSPEKKTSFTAQQQFTMDYAMPELDFTCTETIKKVSDIDIIPPEVEHDDQLIIDGNVTYVVLGKYQGVITHLQVICHKFEATTRRAGEKRIVDSIPPQSKFIFGRKPPLMIDENDNPLSQRQQRLLRNLTMPRILFNATEDKQQLLAEKSFSTGDPVDIDIAKIFLAENPTKVIFEGTDDNTPSPNAVFSFDAPRKTGDVYTQNGLPTKLSILEKDEFPQGSLKVKITTKMEVNIEYGQE